MGLFLGAVDAGSSEELLDDAELEHSHMVLFGGTVDVEAEVFAVSASKEAVGAFPSSSD